MLTHGIFFVNIHIDLAHYMRRFIVRTCNAFNESPKRRRKIKKKKKTMLAHLISFPHLSAYIRVGFAAK